MARALIAGRSVPLAAEISDALEVSLQGTADASVWTSVLAAESLVPQLESGRVRLQLSALSARFKGIRFCELNLVVFVQAQQPEFATGAYLPCAFNSLASFAWVERRLFHCPYHTGEILVQAGSESGFGLKLNRTLILSAQMAPAPLGPLDNADWQGEIYLPTAAGAPQRSFFAHLSGPAQGRSWGPADRWQINTERSVGALKALQARPFAPALRLLAQSEFAPDRWIVRHSARHQKSRTLLRA